MPDTYKVRMTVLAMVSAAGPRQAENLAVDMAEDAGLDVLQVEEPDLVEKKPTFGSLEGDIYP